MGKIRRTERTAVLIKEGWMLKTLHVFFFVQCYETLVSVQVILPTAKGTVTKFTWVTAAFSGVCVIFFAVKYSGVYTKNIVSKKW